MKNQALSLAFVVALGAITLSCSSDESGPTNGGGCTTPNAPDNAGFCSDSCGPVEAKECTSTGRTAQSCCVLVGEPKGDPLKRTTDTKEFSDPSGGAPDLSCFDPAGYPPAPPAGGDQMTASLAGVIKPFANGGCAEDDLIGNSAVVVEVYKVKRTGDSATDGALGDLVGAALTASDTMPIVEEDVTNCDEPRKNRQYEYPNVPMYTELVIKSYGNGWQPLYAYNIYISESDPDYDAATGSYDYDVRALAEDDYQTIPAAAIGQTISPGNGALGGEVHDCGNVRLQFARVDISAPRKGLSYYNNSEDDPLPDLKRDTVGTGRTALYTAFDIPVSDSSGTFARVTGVGLLPGGELVSLGYFDARVFPDSVTSVSLRGLRPFQVP